MTEFKVGDWVEIRAQSNHIDTTFTDWHGEPWEGRIGMIVDVEARAGGEWVALNLANGPHVNKTWWQTQSLIWIGKIDPIEALGDDYFA